MAEVHGESLEWESAIGVDHAGLGPEDLRISVEPQRLSHALELIGRLVDDLQSSRAALDEAAGDADVRGDTAHSLQRVVRFSRFTARRDAGLLDDLAQAVQQLINVIHDVRGGNLDQLRTQWGNAQAEFIAGAKAKSHPHPRRLLADLDAELTEQYRPMFRKLHGRLPPERTHFVAVDSRLDDELRQYKHAVRPLLEEFEQSVKRVRHAEREVRAHLAWEPRERRRPEDADQKAEQDPSGISGPKVLRRLRKALDQGATVLEHAIPQLLPIARSIDDGMLPEHGDDEHHDKREFKQEWEQHLQRRIKRMQFVSETSDTMANALAKLDAETASQIFKDQDDD